MSLDDRLRLAMAGLHPERRRSLVAEHGSPAAVLAAIRRGSVEVSRRASAALRRPIDDVHRALRRLEVSVVWSGEAGYPAGLDHLEDAPDLLFVRGRIPAPPAVAVVGTRTCTSYGRSLARAYGAAISGAGWVTVSGLARGIDGEAHFGSLEGGGPGIAVLGSGSNVVYPPEHRDLHERLIDEGGAVVTEYPPGTPPEAWRFPPRNRIIAGLAEAVVVVEAASKGGALITAAAAVDQAKAVLAVPGDVDREASEGCNLLIRDGAIPVLGPEDLIEALSLIVGPPARQEAGGLPDGSDRDVLDGLGPAGSSLEQIAAAAALTAGEVMSTVARLEAAGLVVRSGSRFVRTAPDR